MNSAKITGTRRLYADIRPKEYAMQTSTILLTDDLQINNEIDLQHLLSSVYVGDEGFVSQIKQTLDGR